MRSATRQDAEATRRSELASILAVAFLRLAETRRRPAISGRQKEAKSVDVLGLEPPHDDLRRPS